MHLHVASGWSLRHGADSPEQLVAVAAEQGLTALALTDRDGVAAAVRFATACSAAGIAPLLGADLAVRPPDPPPGVRPRSAAPTPVRGGASVDPRWPRLTVLARGANGWAALCRLVSRAHADVRDPGSGGAPGGTTRSQPAVTREQLADLVGDGHLLVLLGPASDLGAAVTTRRDVRAQQLLAGWRDLVPTGSLAVEVVHHRAAPGSPAAARSAVGAARLLGFADAHHVPAVLTNAVRYARPEDAVVADVLDATRRLVPLDVRHLDERTGEAYLKSTPQMVELAHEVARHRGGDDERTVAHRLLDTTAALAAPCVLDPRDDLGIGAVHFPELSVVSPDAAAAGVSADAVLRQRCEDGLAHRRVDGSRRAARERLDTELDVIAGLGYATYFLTVGEVCDLIRSMGVRVAARGSGAGSLVNYALGVSGVDPMRHDLLFERFLSPLRAALPDIDVDVESARRTEVYERIIERFGAERVACVCMVDTYRVRHAVRDVGAALGLPVGEIDTLAKAFPHIRARDARAALRELPELRASGIGRLADEPGSRFDLLFDLVEKLDGLPRHRALHPCGVLLSDASLLNRTPVEPSALGFPMSQFDKDDVEELGLLKLDVLGIRMQSAMAHALDEIDRVDGEQLDLDAVPFDDPATFDLIRSTHTLGCFQIESPGQRELVGKFAPETFDDLIIDISLFRPGPVKSDMVTPFLSARQGWSSPQYLHPDLEPVLRPTGGVVVFHEQVLQILSVITGCTLAQADERRRALGDPDGQAETREWFYPRALRRGYDLPAVERIWEVLRAFASFGFCKAHAAAFALPTYQSAWLKAHHPAAFLAGVLTHDPGMYPKRLILDDARQFGIAVLPLDVNASQAHYQVEHVDPDDEPPPRVLEQLHGVGAPRGVPDHPALPDARGYGIRLGLADVKGINDAEVAAIVGGRPFASLADFWHRAGVSRPVAERLVVAGAFDSIYGLGSPVPVRRRERVTRRDLLLQVAELDRWTRAGTRGRRQTRAARSSAAGDTQLALDLGPTPQASSGLPEMTDAERVHAELEVLGLDASRHVVASYTPLLRAIGVTRSVDLLSRRSGAEVLVAGVKVATQTPPIRSGRRVVFVTLDDATGPVDATFFEDAQGPYAATLFHSWFLLIRGVVRRTGPRGISLRATGCWELTTVHEAWQQGGPAAVEELLAAVPVGFGPQGGAEDVTPVGDDAVAAAAASRSTRPVMAGLPEDGTSHDQGRPAAPSPSRSKGGGMGRRRVLVHASGFRQSPYADVRPPGEDVKGGAPAPPPQEEAPPPQPPRKLWHSSPGSAGH